MHYSILIGGLLLGTFLLSAKSLEGTWIPPSAIFMVALYFHGIHAPLLYDDLGAINAGNLESVLNYALLAQFAFLLGYSIVGYMALVRAKRALAAPSSEPLLDDQGVVIAGAVAVVLVLYGQAYAYLTGALDLGKGAFAYEASGSIFYRFATFGLLVPSLLLALVMSIPFHARTSLKFRQRFSFILSICALFLLTSLLSFERSQMVKFLLFASIYYHYRVKPISVAGVIYLGILVFVIQAFSSLRVLGTGILGISSGDMFDELTSDKDYFTGILVAIPGQEVLAEVMDIVPYSEPFKYGATYFDSFVGLFLPRALGLSDYENIKTPAYWFKEVFAWGTTGHGFDFSLLAEAYLNFGSYGIFVIPLIIGGIIFKLSTNIRKSNSLLLVAFSITTLISITFALRSDSNTLFKSVVYLFLPIYLVYKIQPRPVPTSMANR